MSFFLVPDYLQNRNTTHLRSHTLLSHPLFKKDFTNASLQIINFLDKSVLAQAKYNRYAYLYNISAEKCFNNKNNNYSLSESLECEKLIFKKDPILSNINDFKSYVQASLEDQYEKKIANAENDVDYERKHMEFLLQTNYASRYYYYFIAKNLFIAN
jgi:hypothetical protein